jgi:FtsP/CotA-like multicopper oxidase with cupredoxin domain
MKLSRITSLCLVLIALTGKLLLAQMTASEARVAARGIRPQPSRRFEMVDLQKRMDLAKKVNTPFHNPSPHVLDNGCYPLTLVTKIFPSGDAGAVSTDVPDKFNLLSYNEQSVGPTIRVKRGTTLKIRFKNALHGSDVKADPGPDPRPERGGSRIL